jgi:hypothetical protein
MLRSRLALGALALLGCAVVAGSLTLIGQDKDPASAGDPQGAAELERILGEADRVLERQTVLHRREQARKRLAARFRPLPGGVSPATLKKIASCESGGNPRAVSANGLYHGKYQFHPDTWRSVGGTGLPSRAPEVEQDYRAATLLVKSGPGQWPVCGA